MEITDRLDDVRVPPGFRAAVAQLEPRIGEVGPNREWVHAQLAQAARAGADLVVSPALAVSGHTFADWSELRTLAEPVDSPTVSGIVEACDRLGLVVVLGLAELTPEGVHNAAVVVSGTGVLGVARAAGLTTAERRFFAAGEGPVVVDTPLGRLGIVVGADASNPKAQHDLVLAGAQVLCAPTTWVVAPHPASGGGAAGGDADLEVRRARRLAHAAGVPLLVADRVGVERGLEFAGRSVILDATGTALAGPASATDEELLVAEVSTIALDTAA